jgi:uncharacterized protein (TIGR03067 family)
MTVLLFVLPALPVLADEGPNPEPQPTTKIDLKKMQGTWKVVRAETKAKGAKNLDGVRFIIKNDQMTIKDPNLKRDETATFKLDAKKRPHHINITPTMKGGPREVVLGIYKFEKDQLIIAFNEPKSPRPTRFDALAAMKLVLQKRKEKK